MENLVNFFMGRKASQSGPTEQSGGQAGSGVGVGGGSDDPVPAADASAPGDMADTHNPN